MTDELEEPPAGARTFTLPEFRAAVSESFVPLRVESEHPDPFWGRLRESSAEGLHITQVAASDHHVERTADLIAPDEQRYFKLSMQLRGTMLLIQDGRETLLQPGDLAVYDTHRPYSQVFDSNFTTLIMMFPQHLVDVPAEMVGQLTAVRMSSKDGLGQVIAPFLLNLGSNLDQLSGPVGGRLAHSALDLVSTMVASELDFRRTDRNQALLQRILGYIDENLASPQLGPTEIAAAHFISVRHLHGIFRKQDTTVSSWIRERRLERCRRSLGDPLQLDRSVASIAARWGFVDAAYFSRIFKLAYGETPSDVRAGVLDAAAMSGSMR